MWNIQFNFNSQCEKMDCLLVKISEVKKRCRISDAQRS